MGQRYPVTEYDIQALVDNELDAEFAKHVRAFIAETPKAQEYYNCLMEQKKMLQRWAATSREITDN